MNPIPFLSAPSVVSKGETPSEELHSHGTADFDLLMKTAGPLHEAVKGNLMGDFSKPSPDLEEASNSHLESEGKGAAQSGLSEQPLEGSHVPEPSVLGVFLLMQSSGDRTLSFGTADPSAVAKACALLPAAILEDSGAPGSGLEVSSEDAERPVDMGERSFSPLVLSSGSEKIDELTRPKRHDNQLGDTDRAIVADKTAPIGNRPEAPVPALSVAASGSGCSLPSEMASDGKLEPSGTVPLNTGNGKVEDYKDFQQGKVGADQLPRVGPAKSEGIELSDSGRPMARADAEETRGISLIYGTQPQNVVPENGEQRMQEIPSKGEQSAQDEKMAGGFSQEVRLLFRAKPGNGESNPRRPMVELAVMREIEATRPTNTDDPIVSVGLKTHGGLSTGVEQASVIGLPVSSQPLPNGKSGVTQQKDASEPVSLLMHDVPPKEALIKDPGRSVIAAETETQRVQMTGPAHTEDVLLAVASANRSPSEVSGTGQLTQTYRSDVPIPAPQVQIAAAVLASGDQTVELLLSPEELGHVRIDLRREGDTLLVNVSAERQDTLDLLRRNAEQLLIDMRSSAQGSVSLAFGRWSESGSGDGAPAWMADKAEGTENAPPEVETISMPGGGVHASQGLFLRI